MKLVDMDGSEKSGGGSSIVHGAAGRLHPALTTPAQALFDRSRSVSFAAHEESSFLTCRQNGAEGRLSMVCWSFVLGLDEEVSFGRNLRQQIRAHLKHALEA